MKRKSGFTLIELMIVLSIIGILELLVMGIFGDGSSDLYGYLNHKDISGRIDSVSRGISLVDTSESQLDGPSYPAQVVIKQSNGALFVFLLDDNNRFELFDRIKAMGKCVAVRVYPYPPWKIFRYGTYHGGHSFEPRDCN